MVVDRTTVQVALGDVMLTFNGSEVSQDVRELGSPRAPLMEPELVLLSPRRFPRLSWQLAGRMPPPLVALVGPCVRVHGRMA